MYYTTTGDVYAKKEDAETHQGQINYAKESKEMIEMLKEIKEFIDEKIDELKDIEPDN